jgi:hypothetical protein
MACKSTCGLKSLSYLRTAKPCVRGEETKRPAEWDTDGLVQDHNISGGEVNAQPSRSGTEKKNELGRPLGVKLVHLGVAAFAFRVAATNESRERQRKNSVWIWKAR